MSAFSSHVDGARDLCIVNRWQRVKSLASVTTAFDGRIVSIYDLRSYASGARWSDNMSGGSIMRDSVARQAFLSDRLGDLS